MEDRVRLQIDANGVADVCLVRADKMNALDMEMFDALAAVVERLKAEPTARVVVPTAASGIFSALMVGIGRAVGETMIVVRSSGNNVCPEAADTLTVSIESA